MPTRTLDLTIAGQQVPTPVDFLGEGPDVLLLPALSSISSREEMLPLANVLADTFRCIIPDWPGFGARERSRLRLTPDVLHAFLDALLETLPGPYAIGAAAGHAAGYLAGAAGRHPTQFERLVLIAPTWRGPLPTAMGEKRAVWFGRIRGAVEMPLVGEALYRLNLSRPVIGRMMRAHVYAEPRHVTPSVIKAKHRIARQPRARFGTAAFVTGGLDPVPDRDAFLHLIRASATPVTMLRPTGAPNRSGAEMDALTASSLAVVRTLPGALSPHEEFPQETAAAIRAV